jgi:hypothetical protein
VSITVRHTIADANINLGLAKLERNGRLDLNEVDLRDAGNAATEAVTTGTDTLTTLACDVTAFQGSTVDLFLLVLSDIATSPAQQEVPIDGSVDGNVIKTASKVHLPSGHGVTLFANTDDRWAVTFAEASSGSSLTDGEFLPSMRTVVWMVDPSGDTELTVWPRFTPDDARDIVNWSTGNYKVLVDTLGRSTVKGISIFDSTVASFAPSQGRQVPGLPPVAGAIQELYQRGSVIHHQHTRVFHAGPSYDLARVDSNSNPISMWGDYIVYDDSTWQTLGSCWLGTYARNNINGGSSRYRNRIRVSGWLAIASRLMPPNVLDSVSFSLRASAYSYSGGAWTGSATNGTSFTHSGPESWTSSESFTSSSESASLLYDGYTTSDGFSPSFHYLRGAFGATDIARTGAGLIPFSVDLEDAQTTATDRMLRLEIQGITSDATTPGWSSDPPLVFCTSITVTEATGAQGT